MREPTIREPVRRRIRPELRITAYRSPAPPPMDVSVPPDLEFLTRLLADLSGAGASADAAVARRDQAAARYRRLATDDPNRARWALALVCAEVLTQQTGYGELDRRQVGEWIEAARAHRGGPDWDRMVRILDGMVDVVSSAGGDSRRLASARAMLRSEAERPSAPGADRHLATLATMLLALADVMDTPISASGALATMDLSDRIDRVTAITERWSAVMPGLTMDIRSPERAGMAAMQAAKSAVMRRDDIAMRAALATLRDVVDGMPADAAAASSLRLGLGMMYCVRVETFRAFDDADRAIEVLEPLLERVDPTHATWSELVAVLSRAYRLRDDRAAGDRARARALGLRGLRGYAWRVLVQSGIDGAAAAARDAAAAADDLIAWCIHDDEPEQAAEALDGARGLVLQAGSRTREVASWLVAAGHGGLADEWTAALADPGRGGTASLRRRVMRTLSGNRSAADAVTAAFLDPVPMDEVRAALGTAGAHALAYLVPLKDARVPVAVVIPACGPVKILRLSTAAVRFNALDAYLESPLSGRAVGRPRDVEPAGAGTRPANGRAALRSLSDWAWYAAMEQVTAYVRESAGDPGQLRLVLVPMGAFGLVPWHAARCPANGRYVIEDTTVSYAASARIFCDSVRRPAVPSDRDALIVGDPTGDLPYAGSEARAIRDTIYPSAVYLGAGAGSGARPEDVLGWLDGRDRSVLHLACHGRVDPTDEDTSYLLLAGGRLVADRLAERAQSRPGGFGVGTVVLAACSTGVSGYDYDEAFSLATVFLAGGARAVIGSLWPVPDNATSVLMYMFHHYLRRDRDGPATALRRAQLWMLDVRREVPRDMPSDLAARVPAIDPDDLAGWAGFTHMGQW
jgi:hypothetical protein